MTKNINIIVRHTCEKCGNPEKMYWCNVCQMNTEDIKCEVCGGDTTIDDEYHKGCDETKGEHDQIIDDIAELMWDRIKGMQETGEDEGNADKYTMQEYIAFALEEVRENDGFDFIRINEK